jgi:hypothetical protein
MTWPIKIAIAIAGLLILIAVGLWVAGWGPLHMPSAAEKQQPKVAAKVEKTATAETAAVGKAETATKTASATIEKRTETHVVAVRATPRPAPVDYPDREFYLGVCQSKLYAGNPNCVGYGGEPESAGPRAGKGTVRRR